MAVYMLLFLWKLSVRRKFRDACKFVLELKLCLCMTEVLEVRWVSVFQTRLLLLQPFCLKMSFSSIVAYY